MSSDAGFHIIIQRAHRHKQPGWGTELERLVLPFDDELSYLQPDEIARNLRDPMR